MAQEEQKTQIKYLMEKQAKNYLIDNHLWLSVLIRPVLSAFTRLDRVTCCFVSHYVTMLLNLLYYDIVNTFSSENSSQLIFKINMEQVSSFYKVKVH